MRENHCVSGGHERGDEDFPRDARYYPPRPPAGVDHPGMANYPSDGYTHRRRRQPMPSSNRWLPPLDSQPTSDYRSDSPYGTPTGSEDAQKITTVGQAVDFVLTETGGAVGGARGGEAGP